MVYTLKEENCNNRCFIKPFFGLAPLQSIWLIETHFFDQEMTFMKASHCCAILKLCPLQHIINKLAHLASMGEIICIIA